MKVYRFEIFCLNLKNLGQSQKEVEKSIESVTYIWSDMYGVIMNDFWGLYKFKFLCDTVKLRWNILALLTIKKFGGSWRGFTTARNIIKKWLRSHLRSWFGLVRFEVIFVNFLEFSINLDFELLKIWLESLRKKIPVGKIFMQKYPLHKR